MLKFRFFNAFTIVLILMQAVMPIPALAMAGSDLPDYTPGSVATFHGDNSNNAGYLPLETVRVDISGPDGSAGSCEAAADETGAWSCQVTLPSDAANGTYGYTATGQTSGASESGSFTVTAPLPPEPTAGPTAEPTAGPTSEPTAEPTAAPTQEPTLQPTEEVPPLAHPFISSDKDDYAPAELVTLTSGNWLPGEKVHIFVNDDIDSTWNFNTDVFAGENGGFTYQFYLPSWFVATYSVVATGEFSGVATTTFTDARVVTSATLNGGTSATVAAGASLTASVTVETNGSGNNARWRATGWRISTTPPTTFPATITCVNHSNHDPAGTNSETFNITAPSTAGTYNAYFVAFSDDACTSASGNNQPSATYVMVSGVVVTAATTLTLAAPSPASVAYGSTGPVALSATLTRTTGGTAVSGATINFLVDGSSVGTAVTNGSGVAAFSYDPSTLNAGSYDVQAAFAGQTIDNITYTDSFSGTDELTVDQRPVTVTADARSRTYGDPDPVLTYQVTSGSLAGSDSFSGVLVRETGEDVGTYAINQGTLTLGPNYDLSFIGADLEITTRPVTVTADAKSKTYGDPDPALTYQITSGSLAFSDAFSGVLARETGEDIGTYAINQGTLALNGNYILSFVPGTFTIGTRAVTVTADPQSKVYGDADPAITYQVTAGSLASGDALSGELARDPGENVGLYAITQGTLALNDNYVLTYLGANLEITPRPITVKADPQAKVYGEDDPGLTYEITSGLLVSGDSLSGELDRAAGENVGSYAIGQGTLTAGTNYTLTFVSDNLSITPRSITVKADPKTKVYGEVDPALTYQITSGSLAFSDTFSGSLSRAAGEDVFTYAISQGSLALGGNYDLTFEGATLTITKATLTVDADDQSKTYGQADPSFTFQVTGFQFDDDLGDLDAVPVCSVSGDHEDAGPYTIECSGGADNNYDFAYEEGTLTVGKAVLTVTADDQTITYGDPDPGFTFQYSGFQFGDDAGDVDTAPTCDVEGVHVNAGPYTIECSGGSAANYSFAYVDGTLTVDPAALTIKADNKVKTYGSANPALTVSYIGFASGDDEGDLDIPVSLSTLADETSPVGDYVIMASGAADANYTITFVNGTLTVNAKALTIKANNQSKTYGSPFTFAGTEFTTDGLVNEDTVDSVTLTSAGQAATTAVLGSPYAIVASDAQGSGLMNYDIEYIDGDFTVDPKALTVTADDRTKTYGATAIFAGTEFTTDGLVNSDSVSSVTLASDGEAETATVGSYAIVASDAAGTGLSNYTIYYEDGSLAVGPKALTITADNQGKIYGESFTFAGTEFSAAGLVNDDTVDSVTLTSSGAAAAAGVGPYAIVASGAIGSGLDNYTISYEDGTLAVSARPVTVTADAKAKVFGEADPALTYQITGGSLANGDAFSGTLTRDPGEDVGSYAILQGSLALGSNYDLTYVGTQLEIIQATLTVTADPQTKIYGEANPSLTFVYSGFRFLDDDSVLDVGPSCSTTATQFSNVGGYPITCSGGVDNNYSFSYMGSTITIGQRPATVTANPQIKTYGDDNPDLTASITNTVNGDVLDYSLATTAEKYSDVDDYSITVTLGTNPNYNVTPVDGTLTISKKAASVTADDKSKTYGNTNPAFDATVLGEVAGGDAVQYSLSTGAAQFSNVGTYPIVVTLGDNPNYDVTPVNGTLTINKKAASVTADARSKTYGDANPALTATVVDEVAGGDAINYTLSTAATQFSNVGTYSIEVTLGSNPNYEVAPADGTLTIDQKTASVTAEGKSKTYGDANPDLTAVVLGAVAGGDAIEYSLSTTATQLSNVGDYPIVVTLGGNPNYDVSFTDGTLTIEKKSASVTADARSKVYGEDNPELTATVVDQVEGGSTIQYTLDTTAEKFSNVGPYPITVTLGDNPNYYITETDGILTVEKKSASVTAHDKRKIYGDLNPSLTATVVGAVPGGDAIQYTLSTTTEQFTGVGTYPIVVNLGLNPNYELSKTDATLTINQRPATVTANDQTKVYGQDNPTLDATVTGTVNGDVLNYMLFTPAGKYSDVGGYPIEVTLGSNPNYSITPADGTLTITQAALTVAADAKSKIYGDANPSLTFAYSGFLGTDGDSVLETVPSCSTGVNELSGVGVYPIICSGGVDNNYSFSYVSGTLTIGQRPATVTADAKNKIYGDDNPALTATVDNTVNGDVLNYSLTTTAGQFSDVGAYPITVTLGDNPNYSVTAVNGTLTINKKAASVTANAKTKIYGDDNPALTAAVVGQVSGGAVINYSLSTTAVKLSNVGSYPITVTLGDNPNYDVTPADGTLTIDKKAASVTADNKSKTYGDDNPALTATVAGQVPGGDALSYTLTTTAVKLSIAGNYPVTVTLGANPNYEVTKTDGTLTVNKAVLTVTADNKSKYFAGPDPAFTFQYSGFVNGETATVVDTPPTCGVSVDHAAVGVYPIVCDGGLDNNYSFNYVNGTLTVAAWTLKGFYAPVDMGGSLTVYNTVKGGSTVPLKFEIFSGTTELTDVGAVAGLTANVVSCTSGAIEDPIEVTATGATVLRYDSTSGQFIFNWQTPKQAGKCYRVRVTADDGSYKEAFFKLK